MARNANGRRAVFSRFATKYRLCQAARFRFSTVERTHRGWYFGRTSRFGEINGVKGPYSSERSVALMIARELIKEIIKRDAQTRLSG